VHQAVWAVAKHAIAKLGYVDCVIYLLNDQGELYQCAAFGPKNPLAFDINNPIKLKVGEGICGHVAKTGIGEIIHDTTLDSRYLVDDVERNSEITVPILADGKVIGVIDCEHTSRNFFTDQDLEILTTIAAMTSSKIDQAKAHEEIARHKFELEKRVEESTRELKDTITQLQESNNQIRRSNIEKETLIKEIHHRVKNNLQIVLSLLNMHSHRTKTDVEAAIFRDCQNRINAMAVIHDQLYNKGNLAEIDAKKYVEEICVELLRAYNAQSRIQLNLNLDPLFFDIATSVPFGLILNELLVDTMKYAYPDGEGIIRIDLQRQNDSIELVVSDTGPGFDVDRAWDTLGLDLINTLTSQLDGTILFDSTLNGTTCRICFPPLLHHTDD
jgi:two-component sensor histidine kinase/putative methionine-R-sulfoxide reductase with GAF domain